MRTINLGILVALAALLLVAGEASATQTWTDCQGNSLSTAKVDYQPRECAVFAYDDDGDDQEVQCYADVCTVGFITSSSGTVTVLRCVGTGTANTTNCKEVGVVVLTGTGSSDAESQAVSKPLRTGRWLLNVAGAGTVEIRGE